MTNDNASTSALDLAPYPGSDPEAAWPLLTSPPQPAATPAAAPQAAPLAPYAAQGGPGQPYFPAPAQKKESVGPAIAKLAIILATAIPLTAIASHSLGLRGLFVAWIGIVVVTALVFLPGRVHRP